MANQVSIENPIINSPFLEPSRHFHFTKEEGITGEILEKRRPSSYWMPVPAPKKKSKQTTLPLDTAGDEYRENTRINRIRQLLAYWRQGGYVGVTPVTRKLLEYWSDPSRERKLFFCQREAVETAIYIAEVAKKYGDDWIDAELREANQTANPSLFRMAFKMATGSGKTVVMAMLIAWQALNKLTYPKNTQFTDRFLLVTPGITIRDRLQVLLPTDPNNYYQARDIVPAEMFRQLAQARIHVVNYHTFKPREQGEASKLAKSILHPGEGSPFTETPQEMVSRVCRSLGTSRQIIVINDEAHHCFRPRPKEEAAKLTGDEKREAEENAEAARLWISGLEAIQAKVGIKAVYDLSATPFYLSGSGYSEGTLFPWVVSDFSLIDAIESGIVKIPRLPVSDNANAADSPTYRDLWVRIREELPKKGRGTDSITGDPLLPAELQGALHSLYDNYEKYYRRWEAAQNQSGGETTPPVLIIVCNNTNVSKLVYDYVAGYPAKLDDGTQVLRVGNLPIFSNVERGQWSRRPNTLLIDSEQLESGEAMTPEFKKAAAREIEEFKQEYRLRYPGRASEDLTDEAILREVMNTVGKPGKLGEHIKCVISVSMLTEGWDANTVTHVLGVRAFGSQLLCEQVVGRALRRMSYTADDQGMFAPEYAEVYGVPFSFIPGSKATPEPAPPPPPRQHVRSLPERSASAITFPRVLGFRYDLPESLLTPQFGEESTLKLTTADVPTKTQMAALIGQQEEHNLEDYQSRRLQHVAYHVARVVLHTYYRSEGQTQDWLFPQILDATKEWMDRYLDCVGDAFPQLLFMTDYSHQAADRIYRAIVRGTATSEKRLVPRLMPYDSTGTTEGVDFFTTKTVWTTHPSKCQINYVVADSGWEITLAQTLEDMPEVMRYVKNQALGFSIPYTFNGIPRSYIPDFIAVIDDGGGAEKPLNLIIEVTGARGPEKAAKVATAQDLWIPAVNNHAGFGRWAFLEVQDPYDAKRLIRDAVLIPKEL